MIVVVACLGCLVFGASARFLRRALRQCLRKQRTEYLISQIYDSWVWYSRRGSKTQCCLFVSRFICSLPASSSLPNCNEGGPLDDPVPQNRSLRRAAQRCGAQIIDNSIDPYRIGSRQNRPRPAALKALFAQASRNGSRNCFPVVKRKWVAKW